MQKVLYIRQLDKPTSTKIEIDEMFINIQFNVPISDGLNPTEKICNGHTAAVELLNAVQGKRTLVVILAHLLSPMVDSFTLERWFENK